MVRRKEDGQVERHERKFGADGHIIVHQLVKDETELNGKGRVFAHTTVPPGGGIGYHVHTGESEIYFVYSGRGEFNDNGTLTQVSAGDVTITGPGQGHGIRCLGTEPLEFIALILYE